LANIGEKEFGWFANNCGLSNPLSKCHHLLPPSFLLSPVTKKVVAKKVILIGVMDDDARVS
jgi:hypothetical protein